MAQRPKGGERVELTSHALVSWEPQISSREHVGAQVDGPATFDPNARAWDQEDLPANYRAPSLDE